MSRFISKHNYINNNIVYLTGIGFSIIRFLGPAKDESELYVNKFSHFIKGPNNKWYVENCPKSISNKHPCPACEKAGSLWDNNDKDNTVAKKYIKTKKYIMNILVVHDEANKENNGKVFLYEAPKYILDKILGTMAPENDFDTPIDVFDMWEGANFRIKTKKKNGWLTYEDSVFDAPKPIFDDTSDDSQYEKLWLSLYKLNLQYCYKSIRICITQ